MNDKIEFIKLAWDSCIDGINSFCKGGDLKNKIPEEYSEKIFNKIIEKYSEPHRYWHNIDHLYKLIEGTLEKEFFECDYQHSKHFIMKVVLAIFYHDYVYEPEKSNNEEKSVKEMSNDFYEYLSNTFLSDVKEAILNTKNLVTKPEDGIVKYILSKLDTDIIYSSDMNELLYWENCIFKEYQIYSYSKYRDGRIKFLTKAYIETKNRKLLELVEFVNNRKPRVGLYVGSFNPFHVGHNNILKQADKLFDKVIIGVGINPDKGRKNEDYKKYLPEYREIVEYSSLVTELIKKLEEDYDVTIIRGLRNASDLEYEKNYISTLKDLTNEVKYVMILSDVEFHHVSSSMIRGLMKFTDSWKQYVIGGYK